MDVRIDANDFAKPCFVVLTLLELNIWLGLTYLKVTLKLQAEVQRKNSWFYLQTRDSDYSWLLKSLHNKEISITENVHYVLENIYTTLDYVVKSNNKLVACKDMKRNQEMFLKRL